MVELSHASTRDVGGTYSPRHCGSLRRLFTVVNEKKLEGNMAERRRASLSDPVDMSLGGSAAVQCNPREIWPRR